MDTRTFFLLILVSVFGISAAVPGTEDQRKYAVPDLKIFDEFIISSGNAGDLKTHYEGAYRYYDIYLDTPDYDLYSNQLSLRFRKKILNGETFYGLQLKSEMDTGSSVRMEIEEAELEMYQVKKGDSWIPLISVLNVLFNQLEHERIAPESAEAQEAIGQISEWIRLKIGTPVSPFQKLSHLNLKGVTEEKLRSMRPVIYGADIRKRSHVYIDSTCANAELKNIPLNKMDAASTPAFFKAHPNCNWMLETSLDAAVFYPIVKSKTKEIAINEFEVENKYPDAAKGTKVLDQFENYLIHTYGVSKNTDSKYCNSIKIFRQ